MSQQNEGFDPEETQLSQLMRESRKLKPPQSPDKGHWIGFWGGIIAAFIAGILGTVALTVNVIPSPGGPITVAQWIGIVGIPLTATPTPTLTLTPTFTPTSTSTSTATYTPSPTNTSTSSPTFTPSATFTTTPSSHNTFTNGQVVKVIGSNPVTIRAQADNSGNPVISVPNDSYIKINSSQPVYDYVSGKWWWGVITLDGSQIGYIEDTSLMYDSTSVVIGVSPDGVNIRSSDMESADNILQPRGLQQGRWFKVTGINSNREWYRINYNGIEAWVTTKTDLVIVAGDLSNLPIIPASVPPTLPPPPTITATEIPDRDDDGISDNEDDCPTQAGLRSNSGCPEVDTSLNVDPPLPTCAEETVLVTLDQVTVNPIHTGGDGEFDGNGPEIMINVIVHNESSGIRAWVWMSARETKSDWTAVQGENYTPYKNLGPNVEVIAISPTQDGYRRTQEGGHDMFPGSGYSGLVNRFEIIGDTRGDDVNETRVTVYFNPIQVTTRQTGNCVS